MTIVKLVQDQHDTFQFEGTSSLLIEEQLVNFEDRVVFLKNLIKTLTSSDSQKISA